MTLNTFSAGVNTSLSSQLNDNFGSFAVNTIYTGTAFNSTVTNAGAATNSNSYEMTLTAASLKKANYLRIVVNTINYVNADGSSGADAILKIEEKYSGGAYGTIFDQVLFSQNASEGGMDIHSCIEHLYTLTANDIANGVVLKFTSTSTLGVTGGDASVTNIQTVVYNMA